MDSKAPPGCDWVQVPHGDGGSLRGLYRAPEEADPKAPCAIVIPGVYGLQESLKDALARLAQAGYHALGVDLFGALQVEPASGPEDEARAWAALPDRPSLQALESAAAWLAKRGDGRSLAAIGLGLGGSLAFLMGCTSRRVAALVSCYGSTLYDELSSAKPVQPLELFLNLDRPVLGLFAERDESLPEQHHRLLEERLEAGHKDYALVHFPGTRHGFMELSSPNYDEASADAAWERTLGFLQESL